MFEYKPLTRGDAPEYFAALNKERRCRRREMLSRGASRRFIREYETALEGAVQRAADRIAYEITGAQCHFTEKGEPS